MINHDKDLDSLATLPPTLNLTDMNFSKVNKQFFNVGCFIINSITHGDRKDQLNDCCKKLNLGILGICEFGTKTEYARNVGS